MKENSDLKETNSALAEEISQLRETISATVDESEPPNTTDPISDDDLITQNLDTILEKKAEYVNSLFQYESDYLFIDVYEKAGYISNNKLSNIGYSSFFSGVRLVSIKVFFLDYETNKLVCSLFSDEYGKLTYYPGNTRKFYCVVISPEYKLYVSEPLQMKGGTTSAGFSINLDQINCKFSPLFQVCVNVHDSRETIPYYPILPHVSTFFRLADTYSDDESSTSMYYEGNTNDSGIIEFGDASYFSINTKYSLDVALGLQDLTSNESVQPYELQYQTVDSSINNTNVIDILIDYDGEHFSPKQSSD